MEKLLTVTEAREVLGGVSAQTIYRLLAEDELVAVKIRDRTFFRPSDLEKFVRARTSFRSCSKSGTSGGT